ncbi:uncharacterized protein [Acropora muricata]|uniref:uncharacterized protein isoform X4 n=1 Tax=Acropora muricata TaxID=159855 RepID=UPI0034E54FD7
MWRFQSLAAVGLLLALLLLQGTLGNKAAGLRKLFLDTDPLEEMSENGTPLFEQNEASAASSQMPVPTAALPSASLASSAMLVVTPALSSAVAVVSGASSSIVNPKPALPSECYNYAVLNQFNRAITYRGARRFCDGRLSGWYRFVGKAGSKMPHSCVTGRRCGTNGPGWLVGRHPSVSEGVARRRVCFADSRGGWYYRSCCRWSTYISVRNCGTFFVYKLRRPRTCNIRYCGDGIPPKPRPSLASSRMLVVTPALSSECYNYAVLNQFNRAITYRGARRFCDGRLSGWYRFVGKAGSKMPHSCVSGRRCGTNGPGWLVGRHPSVSEGVARRRVCFADSRGGWYYRSCCRWSTYISVRNCGTFFVYKLRRPRTCNIRYCGDGIPPKPRPSVASSQVLVPTPALSSASLASSQMLVVTPALSSECYNYAVLDQSNRAITYRGARRFCDGRLSGWYRFVGKAGSKMPHSCVSGRRCGTNGPGWLVGRHPSVSEGVARRRVCFAGSRTWFYRSSCCRWSTYISVRNCGTFFVYKLRRPPTCNLRYCGDGIPPKPRPSIASSQVLVPTPALSSASLASSQMLVVTPALSSECYNYAVLDQSNRAITYRGASHFCDSRLSGWYRFVGKAGSKMPHSCVSERRCGTNGPGWLVGRHPSVSEGVARRRVCFGGSRGWFYRSSCCRWSTYISVRNCGTFFVYKLRRPPTCNLRYCGDGIPPKPRPFIASSQVLIPTPALSSASSQMVVVTPALPSASLASSQMLVVTPALSSASLPSSQGLVSTLALSSGRASLASSQMLGVVTPALSSASIVSSQMLVPTPALPLTLASSSAVLLHTSSLSADTSKGVFLSCLRNTMMVRIPRDRLPSHLDSIQLHLNDPRCGALHVDKKNVLLRTSLTGCGTIWRFIDGKNSFHNNVVISSGNKRSIVRVPFRCSYSRYGLPGVGSRGN